MTETGRSITCRSLDFDRSWISATVEDTDPTTSLWTVVSEPDDHINLDCVVHHLDMDILLENWLKCNALYCADPNHIHECRILNGFDSAWVLV